MDSFAYADAIRLTENIDAVMHAHDDYLKKRIKSLLVNFKEQ